MASTYDGHVISGLPYTVASVNGRPPSGLVDFDGPCTLTVRLDGQALEIAGVGRVDTDTVRFHQKDHGIDGKDTRVWAIRDSGDGTVVAEAVAAF
ncbi:hypothetical protein [Nakamurella endophytica]|uniref:Uncharacterized protein n=1 Tax=Nakamurella endophytica TaxID=1748367 RepID=A0A917SW33_9ACTN|nr:hypothetical protein [Nakamurella endophytica]GGM00584.1 hypothetical protein GCM10011594_20870 [Nakamurella endophytica]